MGEKKTEEMLQNALTHNFSLTDTHSHTHIHANSQALTRTLTLSLPHTTTHTLYTPSLYVMRLRGITSFGQHLKQTNKM